MRPPLLAALACLCVASAVAAPPEPSDRERLRAYVRALAGAAHHVGMSELKLATARPGMSGTTSPPGAVLAVTATQLRLDGVTAADQAELQRLVQEARARRQLLGAVTPFVLLVDLDRTTPWPRVVDVLGWMGQRALDVRLRFELPAPVAPFERSPVDDEVALIKLERDPGKKARMLARLLAKVLAGCKRGLDAMAQLGNVGPNERMSVFTALVDKLLDDPACKVDLPSLQAMVAITVAGTPMAVVPVRVDPRAKGADRVMAGLHATWGEVVQAGLVDKLARPGARPTFFVVAPR